MVEREMEGEERLEIIYQNRTRHIILVSHQTQHIISQQICVGNTERRITLRVFGCIWSIAFDLHCTFKMQDCLSLYIYFRRGLDLIRQKIKTGKNEFF